MGDQVGRALPWMPASVGAYRNQHHAHRAASQIGDVAVLKPRPLAGTSILAPNNALFSRTLGCSGLPYLLGRWADYYGSKAAVGQLCRGWARDLGPRGITVNAVQPGPINTELHEEGDDELSTTMRGWSCLGRFGKVEEVAPLVAFLAGPGGSYITGARLDVDGGCCA